MPEPAPVPTLPRVTRPRPLQILKELVLSVQRVAAEEAATGLVRGAAEGLRDELPEAEQKVRALIHDSLTALGRLAHDAAHRANGPAETTHDLAAAAMRGALEELEREWQNGGFPLHSFVERLNQLLDRVGQYAGSRASFFERPDLRAREVSAGLVEGASDKLHERAPSIAEDLRALAPLAEELASRAGQGLVCGMQHRASQDREAFARFLEQAGRGLIRGLSSALQEELARAPLPGAERLGKSAAEIAEQTAAGIVRGASQELVRQLVPLQQAFASSGGARQVTQEAVAGALQALGQRLKGPLVAAIAAGGAVATLAVLSLRKRR